ncbi:fasciclin-like arabinogalactan protein 7 [Magnolia sinica]|uniref:fasciclin-like arabinogalactan protein 7 n=1 Tax=Magnolia sinica TaxID=86752 RepID=UPI00265876FF|nr:fasciclin-like arabinogalactan protein 7 [Magnolia sinica]XP_058081144.1 fasciclin-like arabinogalactan protein 7 [Magnolia sinica]
MELQMIFVVCTLVVLIGSSSVSAQSVGTPSPAPAPAPAFVNLTDLLTVAGPFHTFLSYLESTKVIDTFQSQANNTVEGITIFVPKDTAFSSLKKPSLANLTQEQLKSLILYHAVPHYYTLADFNNLSKAGPINTFAGGQFTLNFTDISGTVHLSTGWSNTKISSSVYTTNPVSLYQVDKVLLPEAIFGPPPPPAPAPAPAPDTTPTADSPSTGPTADGSSSKPKSTTSPSSSYKIGFGVLNYLVLAVSGSMMLFL